MSKKRILCFASHYLPGFRAGGPVRSLMGMCEWLQDEFDFSVVTRDRDFGDTEPYPDRTTGRWYPVSGARVWYLPRPYWSPSHLRQVVIDAQPDLLYFHSCLDPALAIMPLVLHRLGVLPRELPVLVAPRGQFAPSALALKQAKKSTYLHLARSLGLYRNVLWHATDENEAAHIKRWWGADAQVLVAPNLPPKIAPAPGARRQAKQAGVLRLVFLSRICAMKNLTGALESLVHLRSPVDFDIYGTKEDPDYWAECERLIRLLPQNVKVHYRGVVSPQDVVPVLSSYDVFFLPTLGENFGHVILEALVAGCPVVLSDRTPWRNLAEKRVGFDVPLGQPGDLVQVIEKFAAMADPEFQAWSGRARQFGMEYCHNEELAGAMRRLLEIATGPQRPRDQFRAI